MFLSYSLFLRLKHSSYVRIFVGTVHKSILQNICNITQCNSCIDYLYFFKVQKETNKNFEQCQGIQATLLKLLKQQLLELLRGVFSVDLSTLFEVFQTKKSMHPDVLKIQKPSALDCSQHVLEFLSKFSLVVL